MNLFILISGFHHRAKVTNSRFTTPGYAYDLVTSLALSEKPQSLLPCRITRNIVQCFRSIRVHFPPPRPPSFRRTCDPIIHNTSTRKRRRWDSNATGRCPCCSRRHRSATGHFRRNPASREDIDPVGFAHGPTMGGYYGRKFLEDERR